METCNCSLATGKGGILAYDVYMFNKIGLKNPYGLSGTRSFNYLRTIDVPRAPLGEWTYSHEVTVTEKSPDTKLIAVPFQATNAWLDDMGWFNHIVIENIGVSGNKVRVGLRTSYFYKNDYRGYTDPAARLHVFETHNENTRSGWGAYIKGATDFTAITSNTQLGFIVWSYSGTITDSMTLPSNLPNRDSQLVLAYWDHPSAVVEYDHITNRVLTPGNTVKMDIIIIQSGFTPPLKKGDSGLFLFNKMGQPVITNHYPPIKAPETIHIGRSESKVYDRPLVPLARYGVFFTGSSNNNRCWHGGLRMLNGAVSVKQGSYYKFGSHKTAAGNAFYSECDTIVLNRDDYF